ncbi:phage replication initiation protein, partial [Thermoactinomyces sp. DSM 45891]|uniref:replication initiation factor domain-containing protein n=1 Tax=Thermoactinomyces sp. DSM 45891 TaxID=1761907 RepID=UPI00092109E1
GQTIYLGSSSSLLKVRFYDKYKEALKDGNESELEGIKFWNRTELELKDERAVKVAWLIANEVDAGEIVTGVLNYYVRFTTKGTDSNKSRWKTWKKWERFIGDTAKIKLTELPKERTVETKLSWLDRQVTPTLATIVKAESEEFLLELVQKAVKRLKDQDFIMIDQYKDAKQVRDERLKQLKSMIRVKSDPPKDQTAM